MTNAEIIDLIRTICNQELGSGYDYPYFNANYLDGEAPDDALLRLFNEERPHHVSDVRAILTLCYG